MNIIWIIFIGILVLIIKYKEEIISFFKANLEEKKEKLKKLFNSITLFYQVKEEKEDAGQFIKKMDNKTIIAIIGAICIVISIRLMPLFDFASTYGSKTKVDYTVSYLEETRSSIEEAKSIIGISYAFILITNISLILFVLTNRKKDAKLTSVLNILLLILMYLMVSMLCYDENHNRSVIPNVGYITSFITAVIMTISLMKKDKKGEKK